MRKLNKTLYNNLKDTISILNDLNYYLKIIAIIFTKDYNLAINLRAQLTTYYNCY